jgi:hypothetical protein
MPILKPSGTWEAFRSDLALFVADLPFSPTSMD